MFDDDEIAMRFDYHRPDEATAPDHVEARGLCRDLAVDLVRLLPACRETSLAMTKLEEVLFWANAAIARERSGFMSAG